MSGPFDHLHIKGRTAGSSNELSFDVLDAVRSGVDNKKSRTPLIPTGIKPSQGTYHGVAGTSTLSAVPEVERRKRIRRNRVIRLWALSVMVVIVLAAAGAYFGYRLYQGHVEYSGRFSQLVDQIVAIDKTTVEIDVLMKDPLNSVEKEKRISALAHVDSAQDALALLIADTEAMEGDSSAPQDSSALDSVKNAAHARSDMLTIAADTFKLSEIVNNQIDDVNKAWSNVLSGDAEAREAAKAANTATSEAAISKSRAMTQSALEKLEEGRIQLSLQAHEMESVTFAAELAYIDKRLESLEAAIKTSDALLSGNRATAIAANAAYNELDAQAATLAAALPASIGDQVKAQYADQAQTFLDRYGSARARAATADSTIRSTLPA